MLYWTIESITLDLKYTWKISRNASDQKTNLIVTCSDGKIAGKGEAAPNVRYNESAEEGLKQFESIRPLLEEMNAAGGAVATAHSLQSLLRDKKIFNALAFAIESAWIHYRSGIEKRTVSEIIGLESAGEVGISYTIPIMETGQIKSFYNENRLFRFPYIKLKVNHEDAFESVKHLSAFCAQPVMVDANESFTDVEQCIYWMEKIKRIPLVFIEQPMPAKMIEESEYLKKYSRFTLFADESVTDTADFSVLKKSFDGINMKLMKAGGYLNGLRILKEAKQNSMQTMIGCMVETTLAISSAMQLSSLADYADLDSFLLVVDEPFGLVTEAGGRLTLQNDK
jgi:L-alanine-DL-glutamate epimerase-like enolase superfamily enzyme